MKKIFIVIYALALGVSMTFAQDIVPLDGQAGTTLTAYKTAAGHLERTFHWTIDKSVTPNKWDLFTGDDGTSQYTVAVTKDNGTDVVYVEGEICVTNGGGVATENLTIWDDVLYKTGGGAFQVLLSVQVSTSDKPILAPGESYCYSYKIEFTPVPGAQYKNSARITITNHSGHLGTPFGPSPDADFSIPATPDVLVTDNINVDDTNGGSRSFSDDGSVSYDKTLTCDGDEGTHSNTATIRETGQSDDASVTVNCYALKIEKDTHTLFKRTYDWTIDKSADQSSLTLATGQSFLVNYSVKVDATYTDSDWSVDGTISVHNTAPIAATINSLLDMVSGVGAANVNCGVSFPYTLAAGVTLTCSYSANLPDASSRTNTATATLQNYSYDKDGNATASGTTDFSSTAPVDFDVATINQVDDCIDASDTYAGSLGIVCVGDAPKTFTYSRNVGPYNECGGYTVVNTASFVTNNQAVTGSDSWTVNVNVPCGGGCTLTPGYWKTHSKYGPAPYDDNWANIGEDTPFFLSGQSYYDVLWTSPSGGNAYYILAHQYIAAVLNILNGASSTSAVDAAIAWAETFFNTYTPSSTLSRSVRNKAITYAETLDDYNNGLIGPGHCSEENQSVGKAGASNADNLFTETNAPLPEAYALAQNYPNPFNPSTTFAFDLPKATEVKLTVYSITGQVVATVFSGQLNAGHYTFTWEAPANIVSGVYLYKLETAEFTSVKKMIFQK